MVVLFRLMLSEMAQWIRVLATKLDTLSSIPGTQKAEEEN